jgi:hypothetical protein
VAPRRCRWPGLQHWAAKDEPPSDDDDDNSDGDEDYDIFYRHLDMN